MSKRYHVNQETGAHGECTAQPGNCPVGGDSEQHFDNEQDAKVASEKKLSEIHGGTMKSHQKPRNYGNLPVTKEEFVEGMNSTVDEIAESYEKYHLDDAMDTEDELVTPIYPETVFEPAEYATAEVSLDKKATKEYFNLVVEKALNKCPEVFDEAIRHGYPFTDDKAEASKIMSRDMLALVDNQGVLALEDSAFSRLKGKVSDIELNRIHRNAEDKVESAEVSVNLVDTMERSLEGASGDHYQFEVTPSNYDVRMLRKELGK